MGLHFGDVLGEDVEVFRNVARLQNEIVQSDEDNIVVCLDTVEFLQNKLMLFLLAALVLFGNQYAKKIVFQVNTTANVFDRAKFTPISFFLLENVDDVELLVSESISKHFQMSDKLNEMLVSLIGEVYNNAMEHSESKCVVGGSYSSYSIDDVKKRLCFYCYDPGIGIIENVRRFRKEQNASIRDICDSNEELLAWAFEDTHTTKKPPRGLGLGWLLSFAKVNNGFLRICNENVLFEQNGFGDGIYKKLADSFCGLFFEMHIAEDSDFIYTLKGERID